MKAGWKKQILKMIKNWTKFNESLEIVAKKQKINFVVRNAIFFI